MKKFISVIMILSLTFCFVSCGKEKTNVDPSGFTAFEDTATSLWGYKDESGNVVIEPEFDRAHPFFEGRAIVQKYKALTFIDENGKPITDYKFKEAANFSQGLAVVTEGDKFGFIDKDGNLVIDYIYDNATSFQGEGYALVVLDGKTIKIDKNGNDITPTPSPEEETKE